VELLQNLQYRFYKDNASVTVDVFNKAEKEIPIGVSDELFDMYMLLNVGRSYKPVTSNEKRLLQLRSWVGKMNARVKNAFGSNSNDTSYI
jgi:hypothetical protein